MWACKNQPLRNPDNEALSALFKINLLNIFKEKWQDWKFQQSIGNYIKEPNENPKTEKYNT